MKVFSRSTKQFNTIVSMVQSVSLVAGAGMEFSLLRGSVWPRAPSFAPTCFFPKFFVQSYQVRIGRKQVGPKLIGRKVGLLYVQGSIHCEATIEVLRWFCLLHALCWPHYSSYQNLAWKCVKNIPTSVYVKLR